MKKLFSFIPVYGFASIAYISFLSGDVINLSEGWTGVTFVIALVVGLFSIISTFASVINHVDNIGSLKQRKKEVTNGEEYLKEMKEHVKMITDSSKDLDENLLAKSNVDHPIVSALSTVCQAQKDLRNDKDNLAYVEGNIAARKAGPFKWVVDLYGES